jgi:DNA-binding Lrp family transcriptional regulator
MKRDQNSQPAQDLTHQVPVGGLDSNLEPDLATTPATSSAAQPAAGLSVGLAAGLDELDAAILGFLERNGRATNFEVGEAVGLSASAASRRIQALEKAGAIRGYRAQIDDRLLGKRMTVYIRVTLERQSAPVLSAFDAAVRRCKGIVSCHLMAGQYDYMLMARVADMDDYGRLHHNELSRLPGVVRLETSFALRDVLEGGKDPRS